MKTIVITLFLLVLFIPFANAGYVLTMKDGKTLTWSNYTEEDNNYCTMKSFGKFCIPKSEVVSTKEEDDDQEGVTVITTKKRSETEKEKDRQKLISDREKANAPTCEIIGYNTFENVSDRKIVSKPGHVDLYSPLREPIRDRILGIPVEGSESKLIENKETCMSVTVRNNSSSPQNLNINNIKVTTAKGNIVRPKNSGTEYLTPDGTVKITDVCFGKLLALPLVIECKF